MAKEKQYASVGGQAVMEGIMMRSPVANVLAVRKPDGTIHTEPFPVSDFQKRHKIANWPFIRGVVSFVLSLSVGYRALMASAEYAVEETEEAKENKKETGIALFLSALLGIVLAFGLFFFLPTWICEGLEWLFRVSLGFWKPIIIGALKIVIVLAYILAVTAMKDIKRLFQYHGAEHKTIFCFEAGEELTVENVRKHSRLHPRCGTSFLLIVILISLVFYTALSMIPVFAEMQDTAPYLYMVIRLLLLPLLAGVSFEVLRFTGRHNNWFTRVLSAPGKLFQLLTTRDPDDDQIEVAIAALNATLVDPETGAFNPDVAYTVNK